MSLELSYDSMAFPASWSLILRVLCSYRGRLRDMSPGSLADRLCILLFLFPVRQ